MELHFCFRAFPQHPIIVVPTTTTKDLLNLLADALETSGDKVEFNINPDCGYRSKITLKNADELDQIIQKKFQGNMESFLSSITYGPVTITT